MAQLAPHEEAVKHRHPDLIVSDAYLNDPIKFTNDLRFDPESHLREALALDIAGRDQSDSTLIDLGAPNSQNYVVTMFTPTYTRFNFNRVFNTEIVEFK